MSNTTTGGIAADQLASYVERIENLEEERAGIAADIRDVCQEAKAMGFDVPTIKKIVALNKMDEDARREKEELLELYRRALGIDDY